MKTLNISLTKEQKDFVSRQVKEQGFANTSEFFRAILRIFSGQGLSLNIGGLEEIDKSVTLDEYKKEFKNAGYSQKFIDSAIDGLKKSSLKIK
jgi:Arc/MetJ-type ribon-helix-helix transcriptional regulator